MCKNKTFRQILQLMNQPGPYWLGLMGKGWKNWSIITDNTTLIPNNEKYLFSWSRDDYCATAVVLSPRRMPLVFASPCFNDIVAGICEIQKVPE